MAYYMFIVYFADFDEANLHCLYHVVADLIADLQALFRGGHDLTYS